MFLKLFSVFLVFIFTACSPSYYYRASLEQAKIIFNKEKIERVVKQSSTTETEKEKLLLVVEARKFAKDLGLYTGNSFTYYYKVDRPELLWVLMASKKDAFELYSWWFPIVGRVPYKGFFNKLDAENEAKKLELEGYETYLRPADAYSTLGWFADPVYSTSLRRDEPTIVNTVLHESFHSSYWFKNDVAKNETLANFFGLNGTIRFYREKIKAKILSSQDFTNDKKNYLIALENLEQEKFFAVVINQLYDELELLYKSDLPSIDKITARNKIYDKYLKIIRQKYPKSKIFNPPNNAELMQVRVYVATKKFPKEALLEKLLSD